MPVDLIRTWDQKEFLFARVAAWLNLGQMFFHWTETDAIRKLDPLDFLTFYIETKVVDDHGQQVPVNEIGELILKGPSMMSGYWKNEKATKETIKDGWLYTVILFVKMKKVMSTL